MLPLGDEARKLGLPVGRLLLALVSGLVHKRCQPNVHLLCELPGNNNCVLLKLLCIYNLREVSLAALTKIGHFILAKSP